FLPEVRPKSGKLPDRSRPGLPWRPSAGLYGSSSRFRSFELLRAESLSISQVHEEEKSFQAAAVEPHDVTGQPPFNARKLPCQGRGGPPAPPPETGRCEVKTGTPFPFSLVSR